MENMSALLDSLHRLERKESREPGAEEAADGLIWGVRRMSLSNVEEKQHILLQAKCLGMLLPFLKLSLQWI